VQQPPKQVPMQRWVGPPPQKVPPQVVQASPSGMAQPWESATGSPSTQRPAASQVWGRQKRVWVPLLQEPRQGLKVPQTSSPQLVPSATGVKRQPVLGSQESVVQRLPSVQRVGRPP